MFTHREEWRRVSSVTLEDGDDGFVWLVAEVETAGGVRKSVRIPHFGADFLRAQIDVKLDSMDTDQRRTSWQRCMEWMKRRR